MPETALRDACRTLWLATLSLMTAYMQTRAPAHQLLLARRIARNFGTLEQEADAFAPANRASFARLAARWEHIAQGHAARQEQAPALSRLASLLGLR